MKLHCSLKDANLFCPPLSCHFLLPFFCLLSLEGCTPNIPNPHFFTAEKNPIVLNVNTVPFCEHRFSEETQIAEKHKMQCEETNQLTQKLQALERDGDELWTETFGSKRSNPQTPGSMPPQPKC